MTFKRARRHKPRMNPRTMQLMLNPDLYTRTQAMFRAYAGSWHQYMDFMEINRPLAGSLAMARKKDIPRLKFAEDRLFHKYFEVFGDRKYEVTDTRHVALDRSAAARFVARQMELMNGGQSEADAFAKTAEEMETDRQVQHAQYHFSADYFKELTGFESAADYFKSSSFRKDVHPLVKHPYADRIKEMEGKGEEPQ